MVSKNEEKLFFEVVENNLKNNINLLVNNVDLEQKDEFELLGNLCYYIGIGLIDFHKNMSNVDNGVQLVKALEERLERINLKIETVSSILDKYKNIDKYSINYWNESNNKNKELVNKLLYPQDSVLIYPFIRRALNNSVFPVGYLTDVNEIYKTKDSQLTYRMLLMFNNFIYNEQVEIDIDVLNNLKSLQSLDVYNKCVEKASTYYNKQKYSFMFYELIISTQELLNSGRFSSFKDYVNSIYRLKNEDIDKQKSEEYVEKTETNISDEYAQKIFFEDMCKAVVFSLIQEQNTNINVDEITNIEDVFKVLDSFNKSEIIDDLVMYLKEHSKNHKDLNFNIKDFKGIEDKVQAQEKLNDLIHTKFNDLFHKLKYEMEDFLQDIPENVLPKITTILNSCIERLIIDGSEKKAYLYQQVLENGVFTFQQLQQMISLVEQCKMEGRNLVSYINLKDLVENNSEIKSRFEKYENVNKLNNEVYYWQTLKNLLP